MIKTVRKLFRLKKKENEAIKERKKQTLMS